MELGIFSRTYENKSLETIFAAMAEQKIFATQFNLSSAGLEALPDYVEDNVLEKIRQQADKYGIVLSALSGTFNMIASDIEEREKGYRQFEVICSAARQLHIPMVTVCTGSKNPESKWKWHEDNLLDSSWDDLRRSTEHVMDSAGKNGLQVGVETEASNIICTPVVARKYLDETGSPDLKIIMDGANLFHAGEIHKMHSVLREAFDILGKDIALAHAKDLSEDRGISFVAAGQGILDFDYYIKLLEEVEYKGPLIMHGLGETQILQSRNFLLEKLMK